MRRRCVEPQCREVFENNGSPRCPTHERAYQRKRNERRRHGAKMPNGGARQRLRRALNEGLVPSICSICKQQKRVEVDHRLPLWDGGADTEANVWPLCRSCHMKKTNKENKNRLAGRRSGDHRW